MNKNYKSGFDFSKKVKLTRKVEKTAKKTEFFQQKKKSGFDFKLIEEKTNFLLDEVKRSQINEINRIQGKK